MALSVLSRGASIMLVVFVGLALISLSRFAGAFESLIYTGYSIVIPIIFGLMILGGLYFGAKHLLTS